MSIPSAQDEPQVQADSAPPPPADITAVAAWEAPPPQVPAPVVVPRQAVLYVLASLFIPGLGSMLNGKTAKGVWLLIAAIVSVPLILVFGLGIILSIVVRIYACVTANTDTQEWNRAHGFIS